MINDKYCLKYGCKKCDFYVCGVCLVVHEENATYFPTKRAAIAFEQIKSSNQNSVVNNHGILFLYL